MQYRYVGRSRASGLLSDDVDARELLKVGLVRNVERLVGCALGLDDDAEKYRELLRRVDVAK